MKKIALDLEFNTVGKIQEAISVGVVVLDESLNVVTEYDSYIKLSLTKKLDPFAQKIHKIKQKDLEGARDFKEVFRELIEILDLQDDDVVMTWGSNDKYSLSSNAKAHGVEEEFKVLIDKVKDFRPVMQKKVRYKGEPLKGHLGVETMRLLCGIEQQVSHKALDDAKCLANIYKYAHDKDIISNDKVLDDIFSQKEAKKLAKQKLFTSYYLAVDTFSEKYKDGLILSNVSKKALRHIKLIVNNSKSINNFKDLSKDKYDIFTKNNKHLVKNAKLTDNTICKIIIDKRLLKIEFQQKNNTYCSEISINKSTVDQIQCLLRAIENESI